MKNCCNIFLLIQKPCLPLRTRKNNWIIHFIPKRPPSGKKWDESRKRGHEGQIWNIYSFSENVLGKSTNLLRQGRENIATCLVWSPFTNQRRYSGEVLLPEENRQHRRTPKESSGYAVGVTRAKDCQPKLSSLKLRLIYSPEMFAVWVIPN